MDWDSRYENSDVRLFGDEPSEYLRSVLARSDVNPQSALCLGDGDGRNGTWLARQGLAVTAVDISGVATTLAEGHDSNAGVAVDRIAADLATWDPPGGRTWDLVAVMYLQCEAPVRLKTVKTAATVLSPGGWFVAEGFSRSGAAADGPGPRSSDLLYDLDELRSALPGFDIVEAFDGTTLLDEGSRHRGEAFVVRLLARRRRTG